MCELYHCENEWLPTKGDRDAILVTHEMAIDAGNRELGGQVYQPLLIPTEWYLCFCTDTNNLPEGVVIND